MGRRGAARYKVNSNAAIIETNDGLIVVDTHSKPSAAQSLYKEVQGATKKPVKKVINTHFHWDHWQGNQVYAQANSSAMATPEEWIETVAALEKLDIDRMIVGHGDPAPKSHLAFFRGYLTDLVGAVKQHSAANMPLDDMKKKIGDDLASKYEKGMSKYPLGQYRDRVGVNVEHVHGKLIKKS